MDTTKTCPKCNKPLAPNAPAGLCPECLMQAGFPTGTEPDAGPKKFRFRPPSVEELKPHFPQLEILSYIGQGGMGAVYKARQPMLDRYVALKILPPEAGTGPGFTERFTREARALARLSHPNIVAVHEFGQSGGYHYLIMEFVDGVNLREMERAQRLSPTQALSIVPKICDALQYAHDEGVVHRDIKPENILVNKKGRVKIADFGIAKILGAETQDRLTGAQHVVGTPHYMAPEQVEKPLSVDHRADIYSVGVVFYEMLTGELPLGRFAAPSKKVQIDVRLDEVVLRALEKEPEARYQQVNQLKTQVEFVSTTPTDPSQTPVPAGVDPRDFAHWEKRAPGWRIRCRKCGFTDHWGKFGIRKKAVGVSYQFGRCPHCRRFGWAVIERGPAVSSSAAAPVERDQPCENRARWIRRALWGVVALLFLDFVLPHSRHFSSGLRFGVTQPWFFLPHDGYGLIFNPRSLSFFSGITAALGTLVLLAVQRGKLNPRYGRWIGSIAVAVLVAALLRTAIEPFKAMNDAVAPEINPGSTVFVYKLNRSFDPGDIVVYRWYAIGYPTKFLVGRVAEKPHDNQISVERRNQAPQKLLVSDIVGKVIFNTRTGSPYVPATPSFGPAVERTISDLATKTDCALNMLTGELLTPPKDVLEAMDPMRIPSKPAEWRRKYLTVQNWCIENDVHLIGPLTRTPHLNAVYGISAFGPAQWNMSVEDLTNYFADLNQLPVGSMSNVGMPVAVETRTDNSGTYAFKTHYGAMGLFTILSSNKWPNPSITIRYKLLREFGAELASHYQTEASIVPRASAELWAPSPIPTNSMGVSKVLDDARKLALNGEYEKALQHHIWYHNHALDTETGQTGVRLSFALSDWIKLAEKYPKALQALAEIRDDTAEKLRAGRGDFRTFMDLHRLNQHLKNDEGTYSIFKTIEQHEPDLAKQCYPIIEDMLVDKGEYQTCKKYVGDPQARYDGIRQGYNMQMNTARHFAEFDAKMSNDLASVRARIETNFPALPTNAISALRTIPPRMPHPPVSASAAMPRFAQDTFVSQVCRLIEILIATGSPEKADDILRQAKEVLKSPHFDTAIADAQKHIAAH